MLYFALKQRIEVSVQSTGLGRQCIGLTYHAFRLFIMRFQACTQERICDGTPKFAAVMDEMYLTKTKVGGSGFIGSAPSRNQKTLVFGAVEVDVEQRCMTGRGLLRVIPNAGGDVLRRMVYACVTPGDSRPDARVCDKCPVWSDSWPGYSFLDEDDSGYHRTSVNHNDRVYADAVGRGGNCAEALFKRLRKELSDMFEEREQMGVLIAQRGLTCHGLRGFVFEYVGLPESLNQLLGSVAGGAANSQ